MKTPIKLRPITALLACSTFLAAIAQEPSLVNSNGTQIDTDAERAAFRANIQAQSGARSFFDRFDDSTAYANAATITHLSTAPRVGPAWRLAVPGGNTAPTVLTASRGLVPSNGAGLFYLGSSITTAAGKFVLAFEFTPVTTNEVSPNQDLGLNVSFSNTEMLPAGGGIIPTGVVHLNIAGNGVTTADFFGGAALTARSTAQSGGVYPWNSRATRWATGRRQLLLLVVEGDFLRVICPGHGEVEFHHPDISDKVGTTTNFWWEPSGSTAPGGAFARRVVLHRVTDSLEQVQAEQWGLEPLSELAGDGQSVIENRLRLLAFNGTWTAGNAPTASDSYRVATPEKMRADKGFWSRPWSGYADYTLQLTQNVITAEIPSVAGDSTTSRLSLGEVPLANVGEWLEFDITGTFAANGNSKRVQLFVATAGLVLADTGAITPNGGTFRARIKRVYLTGRSHDYYGEISVTSGGTTTVYTGTGAYNNGAVAFTNQVRVSGVAGGDVKMQQGVLRMESRQ